MAISKETVSDLAWKVYRSAFKDGDEITIEDDKGDFHWGKLVTSNEIITLTRLGGWSKSFFWHEIVFMCDDGFPFKEIMGMSREEAELRADQTDTRIIRDKLSKLVQQVKHVPDKRKSPERQKRIGGGCPFVYGPAEISDLLNPGNNGPNFWGEDDEELLILKASDSAIAHSFDLSHLFLFDGLTL